MTRFLTLCALLLSAGLAAAQERANTILVLDGSGSMWGQIEGVNKIVIARDVVGTLLTDFPADQNLGLTVYGHRTRGDCSDIETVVPPAPGTGPAIRAAVNGINPRGRTPMTDAIIRAAQDLRYTENAATVILVSDGIETCNPDPCAAAAALEQAGIDFTAHVVGFDVTDPAALAQMQCIADGTGGQFLTASNAAELSQALTTVAAPPPPAPVDIVLVGRAGAGAPPLQDVTWTITQPADLGGQTAQVQGAPTIALLPGTYAITAIWAQTGERMAGNAVVTGTPGQEIEVLFTPPPVTVTFEARIGSETGPLIDDPVLWRLTAQDSVDFGPVNPGTAELANGSYVIEGYWTAQEEALRQQFVVQRDARTVVLVFPEPPLTATLTAPVSAVAGSQIQVGWQGPDGDGDYIGIGPADAGFGPDQWQTYAYTKDGAVLDITVPPLPGSYAITYFIGEGRKAIGSVPLEVTPVSVTLTAPSEAVLGSTVEVAWTGPAYEGDYIGVGREGSSGPDAWENFVYVSAGNPVQLEVPANAGAYEITYFMAQRRTPVASVPLAVSEARVSVTAPSAAPASSTIEVGWEGPDTKGDYIGIGRVGTSGPDAWETFTYTSKGQPAKVQVPSTPGEYVVTYFLAQDRTALASQPITVTALDVRLTAPDAAQVGTTIEVGWTGPDYKGDYIGIGRVGSSGPDAWENFVYTSKGAPATLLIPTTPGDYEITYFLEQRRTPVATIPISVTAVDASLTAPGSAPQGSEIEVAWTGPGYDGDYIGIGKVGATGADKWETFAYPGDADTLRVTVPVEPGAYEVTYFMDQDRTPLVTVPLEVTAVPAGVTAEATAPAGGTMSVDWTGPAYAGDYIGIGRVDATGGDQWETFAYTSDGSPLEVRVPSTPGAYVVSYFLEQKRHRLVSVPLEVTPLNVTLTAPTNARAGETIEVAWTGPNYAGDFIGIGAEGATGSGQWRSYAYTSAGSPATLVLRDDLAPGTYRISYFMDLKRTVVESVTIEIVE
ncbi:MAG: VWA domain-containing protein [Pseudomonadota bacterium]